MIELDYLLSYNLPYPSLKKREDGTLAREIICSKGHAVELLIVGSSSTLPRSLLSPWGRGR
jgi:hypothetical protein